ncbi:MAG: hypothetical protein ACYTGB_16400, partial [Planctomycetota bacterium]
MPEEVDWDALLDQRLTESRQERRDERQAAEPPPGPEAAQQVLEKIKTAAENGTLGAEDAQQAPDAPLAASAFLAPAAAGPAVAEAEGGEDQVVRAAEMESALEELLAESLAPA